MGATAIDTSLPVSTLLRQGTAAAHTTAEKSQGAAWLLGGELDREEYIRFLMMLWHVYDVLESALDNHAQLPALASIYNPHLLGRRAALEADIAHLLAVPQSEWQNHTLHTDLLSSPPPQLNAYTSRLQHVSKKEPQLLLSHSYVRYLGDLSGGQVLRRRVAKAYGLAEDGDDGVEFYTFGSLEGARAGNMGELRKVKEWFRDGMDAGVGPDDSSLKEALVQEAVVAFELNTGLFSALRAPTQTQPPKASILTSHPTPTPVSPPLGDPSTPTVSSPTSLFDMSSSSSSGVSIERVPSKEIPIEIVDGDSEAEQGGRTYSIANVATIVLAVGIAHFILVTGKFIGTGGLMSRLFPEPENPEFPQF